MKLRLCTNYISKRRVIVSPVLGVFNLSDKASLAESSRGELPSLALS